MVLGLTLSTYTLIHVVISLIGIVSGLIVAFGLIAGKRYDGLTALFLAFTIATSVTGFAFPFHGVTPAIIVGVISMVVLLVALLARYALHLAGPSRWIYVVTAMLALYFNCFVLVVQSFQKIDALHALAPTQKEPPFAVAQLAVLVLFVVLTVLAVKRFRGVAVATA
jgi:hypothetical protein